MRLVRNERAIRFLLKLRGGMTGVAGVSMLKAAGSSVAG